MMIQQPRKMPLTVSMIGVKKLTSGWITLVWNHPLTACQTCLMFSQAFRKNPTTAAMALSTAFLNHSHFL